MSYPNLNTSKTVTITNGASLSAASATLKGYCVVGVITDSAWDTNAMTFQVSADGTNYFNLYKEGTEYNLAGVVASAYNAVDPAVFMGAVNLKVRSGTAAAAVNQAGAAVVTLVLKAM